MKCRQAVVIHILKGVSAIALIAFAVYIGRTYPAYYLYTLFLWVGALVLFKGCPMCWISGFCKLPSAKQTTSAESETHS